MAKAVEVTQNNGRIPSRLPKAPNPSGIDTCEPLTNAMRMPNTSAFLPSGAWVCSRLRIKGCVLPKDKPNANDNAINSNGSLNSGYTTKYPPADIIAKWIMVQGFIRP